MDRRRDAIRGSRPGLLGLACLAALAGCEGDFSIPEGAQITCASSAECPSGHVCHLGMCAAAGTVDTTPPDLQDLQVSPPRGRVGATFAIDLVASEALRAPPEVTLSLLPPASAPCASSGGLGYRCSYAATGQENGGLGGVVSFDVRMEDLSRNATLRKAAGALDLDFTAPALAAASVEPAAARLGAVIQVFVTASELLAAPPVLVSSRALDDGAGGATRFAMAPQPGTLNHVFAHLVTAADPQGEVSFSVEAEDAVGNAATGLAAGRTTIDGVAPVVGSLRVFPARAGAGATVVATFDVDEAVEPRATVGGRAMACGPRQPATPNHTCARPVQGDEIPAGTEAGQTVLVEVADAAGNRTSASGGVLLDFRPPGLSMASVAYLPDAANPLRTVARARAGTAVRITVVADEALDTAVVPRLAARVGGVDLPFALVPGSLAPLGAAFEGVVPAGMPDGTATPSLTWTDLAGNAGAATGLPAIEVKTSAPTLAIDPSRVTYVRSPWGSPADEDLGGFVLPAGPYYALAPADPLSPSPAIPAAAFQVLNGVAAALRVWNAADRSALLGTLLPLPGGDWPRARLQNVDAVAAWVTALDDAGNESSPARIENAEWVATARPRGAEASPHAVGSSYYLAEVAVPLPETSLGWPPSPPLTGSPWTVEAQPAFRERFAPGPRPSPRTQFALAHDAARGRTVLFGGQDLGGNPLGDTWEWDGSGWREVSPPPGSGPDARRQGLMAYDGARGRVALFGGVGSSGEVWEWDGALWSLRHPGPGPGGGFLMAYDGWRERMVVAWGGDRLTTWEWDGAAWLPRAPAPGFREGAALAFDAARGVTVLFGGNTDSACLDCALTDELWEYDGAGWRLALQSGDLPGPRVGHRLAFDPGSQRLVLFGGQDPARGLHADARTWDGVTWRAVAPSAGPGPSGRQAAGLAMDEARGRLVLHGGVADWNPYAPPADRILQDTWELDSGGWREVTPGGLPAPAGRQGAAMAFDEARGRMVLFGGLSRSGADASVWEFDGNRWMEVVAPPGLPAPSTRMNHSMAFDPVAGKVVLFGGAELIVGNSTRNDTWEWDGASWSERLPVGPLPPARGEAGLSFDAARGVLVLFGGVDWNGAPGVARDDLWELSRSGADWAWAPRPGPPPSGRGRFGQAQFFDGSRTVIGLGYDPAVGFLQDAWSWDGNGWSLLVPEPGGYPGAGCYGPAAFDPARGRAATAPRHYFGGRTEWNGTGFELIAREPGSTWPLGRLYPALAQDTRRGRMVLFGGTTDGFSMLGDTWELDADLVPGPSGAVQKRTPMVQLTARHADAGFTEAQVTGLRVRANAGGRWGLAGGGEGLGARLYGWRRGGPGIGGGRWVPLAGSGAGVPLGPMPAGRIDWTAPASDLRRWFLGGDAALPFQLRPAGASAASAPPAAVSASYLEVRVRYRAP